MAEDYDFEIHKFGPSSLCSWALALLQKWSGGCCFHLGDTSPGTLGFHLRLQLIVTPQLPGLHLQDLHLHMQGLCFLRQDRNMMYLDSSADSSGKSRVGG